MITLTIHRGANEIGGSCIELTADNSRLILDLGQPLKAADGSDFRLRSFASLTTGDLIDKGILPEIDDLYTDKPLKQTAVILSHYHQDHYGLSSYTDKTIKFFMSRGTKKIIDLSNLFFGINTDISDCNFFSHRKPFIFGDFVITPYLVDHSAYDAYSFLIECGGKRIFYSGDFRNTGRKSSLFDSMVKHPPCPVDYLLMEGTQIGRTKQSSMTEQDLETEFVNIFNSSDCLNLVITSGQNIDRIVTLYRACLKTEKILLTDVYISTILKNLPKPNRIPYPSIGYKNIRTIHTYYINKRLEENGNKKIFYQFGKYKVRKDEIDSSPGKYVMVVRPNMKKDLEHLKSLHGGNLIYSMWDGYKSKADMKKFIEYLEEKNFRIYNVHTSGHADVSALKTFAEALNPRFIIPVHTQSPNEYQNLFNRPVLTANDKQEVLLVH